MTEEDRALAWWFAAARQQRPVDTLVTMVRDAADARERETIARVVAWLRTAAAVTRALEDERGDPPFGSEVMREIVRRIERGEWKGGEGHG